MTGKESLKRIGHLEYGCDYLENPTPLKVSGEYKTIEKELDELVKYKRAFEILKDKLAIEPMKDEKECWFYFKNVYSNGYTDYVDLNKEEYELLEELMKGE